jgi:hypothetical protein
VAGVRVQNLTLTPPQCEFNEAPLQNVPLEEAGKPLSFIEHGTQPKTKTGHRTPPLDTGDRTIATATAVLPLPKNTSLFGLEPMRQARNFGKGVCVSDTLTPLQCEFAAVPSTISVETAGKPLPLPELVDVRAAKALWSTSAQLAADSKSNTPAKTAEELVQTHYHRYINMFFKSSAQKLPPRRIYDFCVDLTPGK